MLAEEKGLRSETPLTPADQPAGLFGTLSLIVGKLGSLAGSQRERNLWFQDATLVTRRAKMPRDAKDWEGK